MPLTRPARSFFIDCFQKRNTLVPPPVSERQKRNTFAPNPAGAFLFLQLFSKRGTHLFLLPFQNGKRGTRPPLIRPACSFFIDYFLKRNTFVPSPVSEQQKRNTPAPVWSRLTPLGRILTNMVSNATPRRLGFAKLVSRRASYGHGRSPSPPAAMFSIIKLQTLYVFVYYRQQCGHEVCKHSQTDAATV